MPTIELASIGHARTHDLRHDYAPWFREEGNPITRMGYAPGSLSTQTAQRYAHLAGLPGKSRRRLSLGSGRAGGGSSVGQSRGLLRPSRLPGRGPRSLLTEPEKCV